jgi:ABC-type nitrate/sulfonate/bicarbonate transport system substrate-binding protein
MDGNTRNPAGLLAALLLALLLAGCTPPWQPTATPGPRPVSIKLNWYHTVQFLGFYVAQARGYYADEGLDVTLQPRLEDDQDIPGQVAAGQYDFSVGDTIPGAQAEGTRVTAIASIFQFGPEAFFARTDTGITGPADLEGRTVVVKGPGWQRKLEELLAIAGLTMDDIQPVEGGYDMTLFFEGQVEVWSGYLSDEVVRARQQGLELVTLPVYEYGIDTVAQTFITGQDELAQDPDLATRTLRASLRGWEWAVEHPGEAVDQMIEMFPELADRREFHLASFDAIIPLVRPPGVRIGTIDCEAWLASETLAGMESTGTLCTTAILDAAWQGE